MLSSAKRGWKATRKIKSRDRFRRHTLPRLNVLRKHKNKSFFYYLWGVVSTLSWSRLLTILPGVIPCFFIVSSIIFMAMHDDMLSTKLFWYISGSVSERLTKNHLEIKSVEVLITTRYIHFFIYRNNPDMFRPSCALIMCIVFHNTTATLPCPHSTAVWLNHRWI